MYSTLPHFFLAGNYSAPPTWAVTVNLTFTTSNGDSSLLVDGQVFITYEDLEANSLSDLGL